MESIEYTWHVLAVRSLEESVQYYVECLGFSVVRRTPDGKAFLRFQGFRIILGECPNEMLAKETGDHSFFAYIVCKGIDELYKNFVMRKAIMSAPLATKPWGMREFTIDTLEGHRMVFGEEVIDN